MSENSSYIPKLTLEPNAAEAAVQEAPALEVTDEEVEAKAKWDISKSWNLTGRKRFNQKPGAITKQKADKEKKKLQNRNAERARKLGIEYVKKQVVK